MDIHEVRVHDEHEMRAFYEALRDAELHGRPGMPMWSERECAVMFRHPEPAETWTAYGAFEADALVGTAFTVFTLLDNTDKAFGHVAVPPVHRGRGIGSALASFVARVVAEQGRATVLAASNVPVARREDHPYRRFAEHQGYTLANIEVRRVRPLPVPDVDLDAWEAEAAPHHEGYRIQTFVDALPDDLVESCCALLNQLVVDAPTGDIDFEPEAITPEAFRARERKVGEQGRTVYTTVGLHGDAEVVAITALVVSRDDVENVLQWATMVRRDHRGHRLGLAVKTRNLRTVQSRHPRGRQVITTNGETNSPMVDINEKMGFHPVELATEFQRRVDVGSPVPASAEHSDTVPA